MFQIVYVSKTKELLIDFHKHLSVSPCLVIDDQAVEITYKYLATNIDDKLSFFLSFEFHVR